MPKNYMPEHLPANYLKHMNGFINEMADDKRLKPAHVSLYLTLFGCWNRHFFVNPFAVNRRYLMQASHIGSRDTYIRMLRDLDAFGYIRYYPPDVLGGAAKICIFPLGKRTAAPAGSGPAPAPEERPRGPATGPEPGPKTGRNNKPVKQSNPESGALPPRKRPEPGPDKPADLEEAAAFFEEMRFNAQEAPLFFHHYEANGWRQSNGLPIRNWKAAAEKWVLNIPQFTKQDNGKTTTRLHSGRKRYGDPL
ncbi:hypothetical protein ACWKWU_13545 [Chitinophaga lutea]